MVRRPSDVVGQQGLIRTCVFVEPLLSSITPEGKHVLVTRNCTAPNKRFAAASLFDEATSIGMRLMLFGLDVSLIINWASRARRG